MNRRTLKQRTVAAVAVMAGLPVAILIGIAGHQASPAQTANVDDSSGITTVPPVTVIPPPPPLTYNPPPPPPLTFAPVGPPPITFPPITILPPQ